MAWFELWCANGNHQSAMVLHAVLSTHSPLVPEAIMVLYKNIWIFTLATIVWRVFHSIIAMNINTNVRIHLHVDIKFCSSPVIGLA